MAANTWALACLCFSLGQTPSDVAVMNQRNVSIPVNIQEARRAELRELVLYASSDQGRTWQQVAAMPPTQNAFTFTAPVDGAYSLRVATINQQGKQDPDNLYQPGPTQRVVIDTMKPLLRMKASERQGDDIAVSWELQEDNPEWTTFRLEYQAKDGGQAWTPIQATAGLTGQSSFRAPTQGPLTVRLSFRDQAGNQSFLLADVAGTITTAAFQNPAAPTSPVAPMSPTAAPPAPVFPSVPAVQLPPPPTPDVPPPAPIAQAPKAAPAFAEAPKTFPMTPAAPWTASTAGTKNEPGKVVASSASAPAVSATPVAATPQRQLPPTQYVNHAEVTLEYELARVGPSGVGSIDLWWTQNDGQSWEHYAVDPESKSGGISNGKHKRTVELPADGVYGFMLVVKSKAGLGKAPPRAGDVPEIRIEVDTRAPSIDLYEPKPVQGKNNTLLLEWSASDTNLTNSPIALEWSEKREGPWQAVAQPLPNTGKYLWTLPDRLPVQVYLRARARDLAGNEAVAVTQNPQLVDLSEPEGRLINVSVSPR